MITVRNLVKKYGDFEAVRDISFTVPEGEILGFLGPNGAGKSTTMRVLTGYTPATAGEVRIGGYDTARESAKVRAILGYLPESAPVYGEMTVEGYIRFFAETKGIPRAVRKRAVGQALEECGLSDVAHRLLINLSKGYRQRAGLAQAIVGDPRVLVLDEPTVGLDPAQIREIRSLIRGMLGRRTVILSTHILPEVSLTCSQVVILDRGQVVAQGSPENIQAKMSDGNALRIDVRGAPALIESRLAALQGVVRVDREAWAPGLESDRSEADGVHHYRVLVKNDQDLRGEVARALVEGGFDLLELRSAGLTLEDAFLQTVNHATLEER